MLVISMKRLMMTTALTLPAAVLWLPAYAQDQNQNACADLEQFLEQDMPEGVSQTEEELNRILEEGNAEQCAVANVELERAMQGQPGDTEQAQGEGQQGEQQQAQEQQSGQLAEQESTRIELSDEVVVEGEVFVDQQPPQVDVDTGETEVVVQDQTRDVTLSGQAPEILVREAPSNIRVEMSAPTITIERQPPEIIVTMPPPDVELADARPQVEVRQSEPTVTVRQTNPTVDLQLRQAEDPQDSQGVSVRDQASGETMVQGETRDVSDAQVNLSRNEPVITYQESEGEQQASVQDQRGQPTVRYETSEPQIEFSQSGEPQIEVTQAGEPNITFREQAEEADEASNQEGQQDQETQQLTEQTAADATQEQQPSGDDAQAEEAAADQAEEPAQETAQTEPPQEGEQTAEQAVELPDAEIDRAEGAQDQAQQADQEQAADAMQDQRPNVQFDGYEMVEAGQVQLESLTGQTVYDANNEDVGDIGDVILAAEGETEGVIIDVGGFLGLGQKPIRVDFDELAILRQEGGDDLRVYIDSTEEELENMERYTQ